MKLYPQFVLQQIAGFFVILHIESPKQRIMKKIMISMMLVIAAITASAQTLTKEEQAMIDLSNQKWTWMAEKNANSLNELFHDQAQFVHMGGYWGKQQEVQTIREGWIWYKKADVHSQEVKFTANTATVYSRIHLTAVVGGNEVVNPFIVSEVYVKEDGKWLLSLLAFTRTMGD